ncbi:LCP family protein [Halanaerobium praevalens]|uniref:Cell envelope-related transcriptional attenuator n=1 Tax=Halanaerobium praevalens (strain ATCC 33744 / DSM 2228 / GSL) TaxID=572479 RepID=E3DR60_HALPG|nr:LCP family protein [Halanaerobium praevalens]ADO76966.1 cell envelope-related transcriptional attenuator [Halanaerobium praevalens DSM 2228]
MAENNSEQKQSSKKKYKWFFIILVVLLLVFIGVSGYYLESGLKPFAEEKIGEDRTLNNKENDSGPLNQASDQENNLNTEQDLVNKLQENLNLLFVGLDDKESVALGSVEADSIILISLNANKDEIKLKKIDEELNYKQKPLKKYKNQKLQTAVNKLIGVESDLYLYLDYQGFEKIINELGGIEVELKQALKVPALGLDLKKGENLLSGKEALNFVRLQDYKDSSRIKRQKMVINSTLTKLKSQNILFNIKEIYNTLKESYNSIETNISPVLATQLFDYFRNASDLKVEFID